MKSNLERVSDLERKLVFTVPKDVVNSKFQKAYQGIQKQANLPGFRKGKAPLNIIRNKYQGHVISDVVNDIIKEAYVEALTEHALNPVSYPQISFDKIEEDQDFSFSATVEIRPEIELKKTDGLKVQKEKLEIKEEQIEEVIKNLRESKTEFKDSDKQDLANGDVAIIDFEGFIGGEALPGGKGEAYPLEIGSNQFIPGFEEKLIGMKVGEEKKVDLKFPEEYHAKDIAGKEVIFDVKLNKIQQKQQPELNDEFAKSVGEYENVEALKKGIKENIQKREEQRIQDDFRKRVLKVIIDNNEFPVPQSQIEEQKKLLLQDVENRFKQQGMGENEIKEYEEKWADDLKQTAKFMIQSGYVVNEIANKENIKVDEDDRKKKLEQYAAESGITLDQLSTFYQKEESKSRLDYQILEEKVLDFLASKCKIDEVAADKIKD